MSVGSDSAAGVDAAAAAALHKAEEFVEAEEGAANKLSGWLGVFVTLVAVVMSVFHLYTAYAIVPTQTLRPVHVGFVLFLCFLVFPVSARFRHRIMWWDWLAAALAIPSWSTSSRAATTSPTATPRRCPGTSFSAWR